MTVTYHALIKTHHITSRKKVSLLKDASQRYGCYALLRSGGVPGIMYVQGTEDGVKQWVNEVHSLRYKDYQLVAKPSAVDHELGQRETAAKLEEVDSVKEFAARMDIMGSISWWRKAMGYTSV